jgi:RNA polymerase sigma factor for flagellar operon FliA
MTEQHDHAVDEIWHRYKSTGDEDLRNRLVLQYAPLVKYVAGRVGSGLPAHVDQGDLVSEGVVGLLDAIEKFDPGRGLQFQTYAVPRIRGAMVDSLRASDWVPRSIREKIRDIERAQATLEARLGRVPTDHEVAAELGVAVAELRETYGKVAYTHVASIDELGSGDEFGPTFPPGEPGPAGAPGAAGDDEPHDLIGAVTDLPERDQVIVALYYYEGLTLSEIGQVLGVSESRVSQLHTRVTLTLRRKLAVLQAA